jgi:hypothetical protein
MSDCIPNSATLTLFADLGSPEDTFMVSVRFALAYGTQQPADHFKMEDSESFDEERFITKRAEQRLLFVGTSYPKDSSCISSWKKEVIDELIALMEDRAIKKIPEEEREEVRNSLCQLKEPNRIRTTTADIPFSALSKLF